MVNRSCQDTQLLSVTFSSCCSLGNRASRTPEKFRLNRKMGFYTKCINVIIENSGPLIIFRSIFIGFNARKADFAVSEKQMRISACVSGLAMRCNYNSTTCTYVTTHRIKIF